MAIFSTKRFGERFTFAASDLTLYLAQKNGEWLQVGAETDEFLRVGRVDTGFKKMYPPYELSDPTLLGPNFQPQRLDIQVLVELPSSASATTTGVAIGSNPQGLKHLLKLSVKEVLEEQAEKQSVYSLSSLNSEQATRIKNKMRLKLDGFDVDEPVDTSVAGYPWIEGVAESEESQRAAFMEYLQLQLRPLLERGEFQVVDVAQDKSLLSIVDPRLPFRLNGTADFLLVNRK